MDVELSTSTGEYLNQSSIRHFNGTLFATPNTNVSIERGRVELPHILARSYRRRSGSLDVSAHLRTSGIN